MRKMTSGVLEPGSWIGIAPRCKNCILEKLGATPGQIKRLKQGDFVAIHEDGSDWLVWDIRGDGGRWKLPRSVIRVYSESEVVEAVQKTGLTSMDLFELTPIGPDDVVFSTKDY